MENLPVSIGSYTSQLVQQDFFHQQYDTVGKGVYIWYTSPAVTVTTSIITFLAGNPCKPLFATVTGRKFQFSGKVKRIVYNLE